MSDELADFLLTRITEDDLLARTVPDPAAVSSPDPAVRRFLDAWTAERVRAECAGKRVLIQTWRILGANARSASDPEEARDWRSAQTGLAAGLKALAVPYRNHPDYRQEWRP